MADAHRRPVAAGWLAMAVGAAAVAAGGGDADGTPTLTWYINPDNGGQATLASQCSDASGGAGAAGADPFGHLHGRNFTATVPGDYVVGFKLFDNSGNGTGGGAIHTPSATLNIRFSAVPEPSVGVLLALGAAGLVLVHRRNRA